MSIASELRMLIRSGVRRIGEIEIQNDLNGYHYVLCHYQDAELSTQPAFGGLDQHIGPAAARDLSTHAADGTYRFAKAETTLPRGWVMILEDEEELRRALDLFYPAALGLFVAQRSGNLDVQNLRDKLKRQTGMYRFARNISDAGAQRLVCEVCGPAHQCAKRILWRIDEATPLDDSEASRFRGVVGDDVTEEQAIPLLCREACNHFVAECRRVSKEESDQKKT